MLIATDGSANEEAGVSGWAWVADNGTYEIGSFDGVDSQLAEWTALYHALKAHPTGDIVIQYDADSINTMQPLYGHRPPRNPKIAQMFDEATRLVHKHRGHIGWHQVHGHLRGHRYPWHDAADAASRMWVVLPIGASRAGFAGTNPRQVDRYFSLTVSKAFREVRDVKANAKPSRKMKADPQIVARITGHRIPTARPRNRTEQDWTQMCNLVVAAETDVDAGLTGWAWQHVDGGSWHGAVDSDDQAYAELTAIRNAMAHYPDDPLEVYAVCPEVVSVLDGDPVPSRGVKFDFLVRDVRGLLKLRSDFAWVAAHPRPTNQKEALRQHRRRSSSIVKADNGARMRANVGLRMARFGQGARSA